MKRRSIGLALFGLILLAGCGGKGGSSAEFFVLEIANAPSVVTIRIEVPQDTDEKALRDWAEKNAATYRAKYNKPVTMHFYRGGHGPEYYVALYQDNRFTMLR